MWMNKGLGGKGRKRVEKRETKKNKKTLETRAELVDSTLKRLHPPGFAPGPFPNHCTKGWEGNELDYCSMDAIDGWVRPEDNERL